MSGAVISAMGMVVAFCLGAFASGKLWPVQECLHERGVMKSTRTYVDVWVLSIDDDYAADADVFPTEEKLLAHLWELYGASQDDGGDYGPPTDFTGYCEWLKRYADANDDAVPGNASWTVAALPLSELRIYEGPHPK